MLDCESPFVVKCYGAFFMVFMTFISSKEGVLHIILEYMDAGSIYSLM